MAVAPVGIICSTFTVFCVEQGGARAVLSLQADDATGEEADHRSGDTVCDYSSAHYRHLHPG